MFQNTKSEVLFDHTNPWPLVSLVELFSHDLEVNWEITGLRIVVPEWMFYIWMVMYGLQVIWVVYGFVALAKQNDKGKLPIRFIMVTLVTFLYPLTSNKVLND